MRERHGHTESWVDGNMRDNSQSHVTDTVIQGERKLMQFQRKAELRAMEAIMDFLKYICFYVRCVSDLQKSYKTAQKDPVRLGLILSQQ